MAPASDISTIRELKKDLLEGKVVPFLGAGASISAGFPSGRDLGHELAKDFEVTPCDDLATLASLCSFKTSSKHLSAYLYDRFRHEGKPAGVPAGEPAYKWPHRWFADFYGRFRDENKPRRSSAGGPGPKGLHQYLAELPKPLLVVTTNYDCLMEKALDVAGKPYDVLIYPPNGGHLLLQREKGNSEAISRPNDLARLVDPKQRWLIYKIHGSVATHAEDVPGWYVITEEDYENALIRLRTFLPPLVVSVLDNKRLLFMGYSLKDWNIRAILRQLTLHSHYRGHLGFLRSMDRADQELWRTRDLEVRKMKLEDLVLALEAA